MDELKKTMDDTAELNIKMNKEMAKVCINYNIQFRGCHNRVCCLCLANT